MAIRLITGRFQQCSNACKKQFYEKRMHPVYKLQKDVCHNLWRAQTALIHWRCFLDFAGVLMIWNRNDMHLTSGEIQRRSCSSLG